MDPLNFLTLQFVLFAIGVSAVVFLIRTMVEYFLPKAKVTKLWNSLILIILPITVGGLLGFFLQLYPYPPGFSGIGNHIIYGLGAGSLSSIIWKTLKELLGGKIQGIIGVLAGNNNVVVNNNLPSNTSTDQQQGMSSNSNPDPK